MLNKIYSKVDLPPSARQPANNGRILTMASTRRRCKLRRQQSLLQSHLLQPLPPPSRRFRRWRSAPGLGLAAAGSLDWGASMAHIEKLRKGGAEVLGGRHFVNIHNNQRSSAEAGGVALVMRRDRGGMRWEDFFLSFEAANRVTKK